METSNREDIKLEQQAYDRFRRLGDRLQLLMLNTIQECLDEGKELSTTVSFNDIEGMMSILLRAGGRRGCPTRGESSH